MQRIPSLDGLRAVSITAVIGGHLAMSGSLPLGAAGSAMLERLPHFGVRVFFVISGFLITTLILQERAKTGDFSLSQFYQRRAWRILPPAYLLLLCLLVANLFHFISIPPFDYFRAFTYLMNYGPIPNWFVGHLWSLSVEEQFYLIWPFLLAFLSVRSCRYIAVAFILISAGLRFHMALNPPLDMWRHEYEFQYSGTAIAFGCLLAIDRDWLYSRKWFRAVCSSSLTAPAAVVLLFANSLVLRASGAFGLCVADIVTNLCILALVAKFTCWPRGPIASLLKARPIVFIGTISYSLYLWQQIFANSIPHLYSSWFPFNLLLIVLFALGSYYLVEKPSLRIRRKLHERRRTVKGSAPAVMTAGQIGSE